ncbi:hypothetical protein Glove_267g14 [Diversispora epigaea]|uniref:Fork-head domain-containing protein n=1 Tax=Diversispora epigaea TaxID=1348612 RepID=A0A397IDA8_9GLOM|nr:hypothetical protein Glove_267g14 [Diversispora epigaea]
MNNIQYYYQQIPLTITASSQMPIITSGQTGIMTTENEQRNLWVKTYAIATSVDQEGDNSITNDNASDDQPKPSLTYISLIGQAILAAPDKKRQLNEICIWIANIYPFYKMENKSWQNTIRYNLTQCPAFCHCERDDGMGRKKRKKAWTIPDEYQECFVNGIYSNRKMKEIKEREESASAFESGETISSSSNGTVEASSSSSPAPCNYVNMAKVENIQDNGISNYEIKETEENKIEMPTWELGVTEYCYDTGLGLEYDQRTYFVSQLNVPEIYDCPDFIYIGCTDPEKLVQVSPGTCDLDNGISNYEIKETEENKIEMPTWELGVTEYCYDTGLGLEYDQRTYFVSQLNVPEIYDCPDFIYIGCTDPEKLVQVSPGTCDLGYIDQGIFNPW